MLGMALTARKIQGCQYSIATSMEDCIARREEDSLMAAAARKQIVEQRPSLVDEAYAALKLAIRDSIFAPGHQASTQELALRFGMSRTPIHEAALRLQEEGLVSILPKRGIVIRSLAPDDIREIYDVIIAIEASAAERAAELADGANTKLADALDAETDRMTSALGSSDLTDWGKADEAFHRLLVERCGNKRFLRIIQTVTDQSHRARMLTLKLRPKLGASIDEHRAISAAIRRGDADAAHAAARRHRRRARDELMPLIDSFGFKHL
jgi:DNA-binding GntR family transcriptional regulator